MMDEATIRQKIQEKLQRGAPPIHAEPAPEASLYSNVGKAPENRVTPVMNPSRPTKSA